MPRRDATNADQSADMHVTLLRMPAVVGRTGLSRSTIYRLLAIKQFPVPVRLATRAVGWRQSDLDQWSRSLPSAGN
jgi:prophage regulatory protein